MSKQPEFKGIDEVLARFDKTADAAGIKKAIGKACALVERSARQKAPKGKNLRHSIKSRVDGLQGVVYTPLEYAPYVEFGTGIFAENGGRKDVPWNYQDDEGEWHSTSGMKPQPYMRPALDENRQEIKNLLKEGLLDD